MNTDMTRRQALWGSAAAATAVVARPVFAAAPPKPPAARVEPVSETHWGDTVVDPYRWMENPADPDWTPFLKGQASYTRAVLDGLPIRPKLLRRIQALSGDTVARINPQRTRTAWFYEKREPGADQYRLFMRKEIGGAERMLLDVAALDSAGGHASLDWWLASPDGRYVVCGVSNGGTENSTARIIETATGRILPETIARTPYPAASWLPDSSGFVYTSLTNPPNRPDSYLNTVVRLHRLNTPTLGDGILLGAGADPKVDMQPVDAPQVVLFSNSDVALGVVRAGYARELTLYLTPLADLQGGRPAWRKVCDAQDGISDAVLVGGDLFLLANKGAPRGQVVRVPAASPDLAHAQVVMPQGSEVIESLNGARDGVYVTVNDAGAQGLRRIDRAGRAQDVPLPFRGWLQTVSTCGELDGVAVRATGWINPPAILDYTPAAGRARDTGLNPAPAIDLSLYRTERLFVTARDGVKIPVTILARRDTPMDGSSPCLVTAYGAYQWSSQPNFIARSFAFLEAGGVLATAHVRGGGEYGRAWHEAGMKTTKPNTWRDLIDCCEALCAKGWTSPRRLAIVGGSAGGMTVGRAMTERPDLFAAVISKVGMSNPLRAEFEPNGAPNVAEFGTVKDRDGYFALKAMDSLHAVTPGVAYPAVMLSTGVNDARVAPHNAAKMAARLQATTSSTRPVLLRVDFEGGHEINQNTRAQVDAEFADDYAFVLWQTAR